VIDKIVVADNLVFVFGYIAWASSITGPNSIAPPAGYRLSPAPIFSTKISISRKLIYCKFAFIKIFWIEQLTQLSGRAEL
jgi:hypothetical protein